MKNRNAFWWEVTVKRHFDDNDWIETFRMRKSTFYYICEELRPMLEPSRPIMKPPRKPLSVDKKVGVVLYYLASCCEYRVVANLFGIHKSNVLKCMHEVVGAINTILLPKYIVMPDETECSIISSMYGDLIHIPQVIGAIDGTHIPILPPTEGYRDYVNRKGWPSIVLQGLVDVTLRFRNINCQSPECSYDAAVFRESLLYRNADNLIPKNVKRVKEVNVPYFIMGDGAYPLLPWLMKAYTNSELTAQEELFNNYFNKGRVHIEMAFGRLKARWRTLLKRTELDYQFVPDVVAACCTLYNILETKKDPFLINWDSYVKEIERIFPQPQRQLARTYDDLNARRIRDALCDYLTEILRN
ncbi:protein ALP1-like [Chelonus insularis]|uniref:protein ALP1-like n=1 Tax=Chelonus insularis TaxID=460826 RepID=UPI00158927EF|nr:protein ALP1-like [Chelonus insularis]